MIEIIVDKNMKVILRIDNAFLKRKLCKECKIKIGKARI